jgi:hypothetical protein
LIHCHINPPYLLQLGVAFSPAVGRLVVVLPDTPGLGMCLPCWAIFDDVLERLVDFFEPGVSREIVRDRRMKETTLRSTKTRANTANKAHPGTPTQKRHGGQRDGDVAWVGQVGWWVAMFWGSVGPFT